MVPPCNLVPVIIIYPACHLVADHTELWHQSPDDWHHVGIAAWICQPLKDDTEAFGSIKDSSIRALEDGRNP